MQNKKYLELDALAAPNGYVVPPTKEDLAYVVHFRKTCQRVTPTRCVFIYSVVKAHISTKSSLGLSGFLLHIHKNCGIFSKEAFSLSLLVTSCL